MTEQVPDGGTWDVAYEATVRRFLPRLSGDKALLPDADMPALGLNSLNMLGLLDALEDERDVSFPMEALTHQTFSTPATLWAAVVATELATP